MRPAVRAALAALVLVGVPSVAADHEGFVLLRAKLSSVFDPLTVGPRWDIELAVRNDGPTRPFFMAVDEYPPVFDLGFTQWYDERPIGAGETRTWSIRIDWSAPGTITFPVPDWFCLRVHNDWPPTRCWSVWIGTAAPDGVYPDDIRHPLMADVPAGDLE